MVEIIIAVAVFAILVVPITSQLISAININTTSTKKQYAIDKAEEIMESFKIADLVDTVGETVNIADGNSAGNYNFELTDTSTKTKTGTSIGDISYNVQTYECDSISLGTAYETYTCKVEISDLAYQVMAQGYKWVKATDEDGSDASYVDTSVSTSTASGTVRNLDNSQVAVIAGATYKSGATNNNLDMEAYEELLTTKVSLLNDYYPLEYYRYSNGYDVFDSAMFKKTTTISVEYDSTAKIYTIKCSVSYVDSSGMRLDTYYVNGTDNVYSAGTVYTQEYTELPPIYLLYTPATYNGKYVNTDNIVVTTSGLQDDDEVVLYIFEANTDMSDTYKDIIASTLEVNSVDDLIYSSTTYSGTYKDVNTYLLYKDDNKSESEGKITAYSNFNIATAAGSDLNITCQDTSADVSDEVYYYDIVVTLTDSDGNETIIEGTRGN